MSPVRTDLITAGRPPGVYLTAPQQRDALAAVRMDVCAFVGVAPRGPAWERTDDPTWLRDADAPRVRSVAVPVQSWTEYERLFGADEGPGLLPHAVAAFFAQGGVRAYVVRIVPAADPPDPEPVGCAVLRFDEQVSDGAGPLQLRARNEGSWGNRLRARLAFTASPIPEPAVDGSALVLPPRAVLPPGAVLRLTGAQGVVALRQVTSLARRPRRGEPGVDVVAVLDAAPPPGPLRAEVVEATLELVDRDPRRDRSERFVGLGLHPEHPRWLGAVLAADSILAELPAAVTAVLPAATALLPADSEIVEPVADRYAEIVPADVFGSDPPADDAPPAGLDALRGLPDVASVVAADLYSPESLPDRVDVSTPPSVAGPRFAPCAAAPGSPATTPPAVELTGLRRDPAVPGQRREIIAVQRRLVDAAARLGAVALLDVPPGLSPAEVLAWRAEFDSGYAAGYHGWPRRPRGEGLVRVPPTAYAAGGIAAAELERGVPHGPAQRRLRDAVDVDTAGLDQAVLGELHRAGVNVLVLDRDGVRITAARTLSRDRTWRQLTARRTVSQLERTLDQQLQWVTFEPGGPVLRTTIRVLVEELLLGFQRAGAFAGSVPETSFFVRVPPPAAGIEEQLLCEIGVAPSEPIEFVLLRILRAGDGALRLDGPGGPR